MIETSLYLFEFTLSCHVFREEIVIWVQKKTGVPVINTNSLNEAKEFLKKHHMFVVGRFEKFEVCSFSVHLLYLFFVWKIRTRIKNKLP